MSLERAVTISIRFGTPVAAATSCVWAITSSTVPCVVDRVSAYTCSAPAHAARIGVTTYGPHAASVSTTLPRRSSAHRSTAAETREARRRGCSPGLGCMDVAVDGCRHEFDLVVRQLGI